MPKKRIGMHNMHVIVKNEHFRTLQQYCIAGAEKLTASKITDLLMQVYIEDCLAPRMQAGESATWKALSEDIPKVAAKVAHRIEPNAFENPEVVND